MCKDHRHVQMAELVASWSKDPSTKVGAVITRPDGTIASVGYNGFPRGVGDDAARLIDRETKYALTIHAEVNAVLNAHERLDGCTAYVTHPPCVACACVLIQAGVKVVKYKKPDQDLLSRWGASIDRALSILKEANVLTEEIVLQPLAQLPEDLRQALSPRYFGVPVDVQPGVLPKGGGHFRLVP